MATKTLAAKLVKKLVPPLPEHQLDMCPYDGRLALNEAVAKARQWLMAERLESNAKLIDETRELAKQLTNAKANANCQCRWFDTHMILLACAIGKATICVHRAMEEQDRRGTLLNYLFTLLGSVEAVHFVRHLNTRTEDAFASMFQLAVDDLCVCFMTTELLTNIPWAIPRAFAGQLEVTYDDLCAVAATDNE